MDDHDPGGESALEQAFREFHEANPHVYALFRELASEVIRAGRVRFSARTIWHRMRWYAAFETTDEEFKLNNNHSPYYARLWLKDHPQYPGFFELRGGPS